MARVLSQSLIRETQTLVRDLSSSRRLLRGIRSSGIRLLSGRPEMGQVVEIDVGQGSDSGNVEVEVLGLQRLEDAIQVLVVQKSAPSWLPFAPGTSYWVPPRPRDLGLGLGLAFRQEKLLTEEEALSRTTHRGWPSSSYFVDGVLPDHQSTKIWKTVAAGPAVQSDEEE